MKKIFIPLLLLLISYSSYGQVDSLEISLPKTHGKDRVDLLNYLSYTYWNKSPHKGIELGTEALDLAIKLKYEAGEGDAYNSLGVNEWVLGNLNLALSHYHQAIGIYEKLDFKANISATANNLAIIYRKIGRFDESIEYYKKSIEINNQLHQEYQNASTYANLGLVYADKKEYELALDQQLKAMELCKENNDILSISQVQHNIAMLYFSLKKFKLALKQAKLALMNKKKINDKVGVVRTYHLLTELYFAIDEDQRAYECVLKARKLAEELSLIVDLEMNYNYSTTYFERRGEFKKALICFKYKNTLTDSINMEKQKKNINDLNKKYQKVKHDKQIALLEKDNEIQSILIKKQNDEKLILIIFGLFCIGLLLSLVYANRVIRKKKLGLEQNNVLINTQKELLTESMKELKESNLQKDKFISIIAHDLRNPFNVILGFSGMLIDDYDSFNDKSRKDYIRTIHESSEFTYNLLEDLLLWAKSNGHLRLNFESVFAKTFVTKSINPYKGNALAKGITITNNIDSEEQFNIDRFTMSTIVGNLVSNAIKFTPNGGVISLSHSIDDGMHSIEIKDNGIGMSQEKIDTLFKIDQNKSSRGTANEKGSGLGLILCHEFITKYGGDIIVTSEKNVGSKFLVKFPKKDLFEKGEII